MPATSGVRKLATSWARPGREALYRLQGALRARGLNISRSHPDVDQRFYLSRLFRQLRIDCVLDVGANKGQYGRELRRSGYRGSIVSFEPISAEFERLTAEAQGDAQWSCHRLALGRESGTLPLNVTQGTVFGSFLQPSEYGTRQFQEGMAVVRQELVPIERLDAVLPQLIPDFRTRRIALKMHTQ